MSGKIVNSSSQWWVMDGKEESLGTDGNSFLGLHGHHVCSGEPPDKAVTFLMAKNTTHTNQENSALLSFNVDVKFWTYCIITLDASNPLLLISIASQIFRLHLSRDCNPNIISKFLNTKTVESHLGVRKSFRRTPHSEMRSQRLRCRSIHSFDFIGQNYLFAGECFSVPFNFFRLFLTLHSCM